MLLRILAFLDFIITIGIALIYFDIIHFSQGIFIVFYLVGKGILFFGDFASFLDLLSGLIVLLMLLNISSIFLFVIIEFYLLQKVVVSYA